MLFIAIGNILVYVIDAVDPSHAFYYALMFDRAAILRGQVWRLFSYIFLSGYRNPLLLAVMMFVYFQLGRVMEMRCGTLKFNCFYLSGVLIIDIAAMLTGWPYLSIETLHYSFLIAYATMCPEDQMLLFFLIPIKMKYLALVYLALIVLDFVGGNFFPAFALINYFLFFGADIRNILPSLGRYHHVANKEERRHSNPYAAPTPQWSGTGRHQKKEAPKNYRHKCTVCGRTDTDYPNLEFRYCSRCRGYYCYCADHINNHTHIQ